MLLSRVAETVYWMARYIERAESTARITLAHATLLLDFPRTQSCGWEPLLAITGSHEEFHQRYKEPTQRNMLRFLVSDANNSGSVMSSLARAREDMRTTRGIVPREAWEKLNDLHLYTKENASTGLTRRGPYDFLEYIVEHCQQITGILVGTMSHDPAYGFARMGRNLERCDMASRVLDVRSASLLPKRVEELRPFEDIQWVSVLKSLAAYQMYRRHVHVRVKGSAVLGYLLQDRDFPRAVHHCLVEVGDCLRDLPRNDAPLRVLGRAQRMVKEADVHALASEGLHDFIEELQSALAKLHEDVRLTYFSVEEPLVEPNAAIA